MFISDKLDTPTERKYTDEGFLTMPARIARTGILDYYAGEVGRDDLQPTDTVRVYRAPDEVFSDQSLRSFANKLVTNDHPPDLVNATNSKRFGVGMSGGSVSRDGIFVKTALHITDEAAIASIEGGKTILSNGYTADLNWTPGVSPEGEHYDGTQMNIRGNHIALVSRGRAGTSCRVADNSTVDGEHKPMSNITIENISFEVSEQVAQAVANLQDSAGKLAEDREEQRKKVDGLQAQLDDAKSKHLTPEQVDALVLDRMQVIDSARQVFPEIEWAGKSNAELYREVVGRACPTVQLDSKTDEYIAARFDLILETKTTGQLDDALRTQLVDQRPDERPVDVVARERMVLDARNAWKSTTGALA